MIKLQNLSKDYVVKLKEKGLKGMAKSLIHTEKKIVHAVQNVNFSIGEGELVGYIGPNGAGKSTTIKMLCGILQPTGGLVSVCGITPSKKSHSECAECRRPFLGKKHSFGGIFRCARPLSC